MSENRKETNMLTYWLLIWTFRSVASELVIPDSKDCILDCDGQFQCGEQLNCEQMDCHFDMTQYQNIKKRTFLLFGHNGLRNRLALILDTCDMLRMSWDDDLAELSNRHHRNCERILNCNSMQSKLIEDIKEEHMLNRRVFGGNTTQLGRNSYFHDNVYSTNFIELAIGSWYMEHMTVPFPKRVTFNKHEHYKLIGDNSFTNIINPQTHRVGCSYAR